MTDPLIEEGHEVLFWGDGLTRHPQLVPRLPDEGATAVVWHYTAPDPDGPSLDILTGSELAELYGLPDQANLGFTSYAKPYVDADYPIWVAPGTSSWNSLVGQWTNARDNLLDAAIVGQDAGAPGYLVTDWGDNGHPPLPVSLPAAAYGAGVAWCRASNLDGDVTPVVDRLLEASDGVGARLLELGDLYRRVGVSAKNRSPLMLAMVDPGHWSFRGRLDAAAADNVEAVTHQALDHFAAVPFSGPRAEAVAAELVATCRLLRHGLWRLRQCGATARLTRPSWSATSLRSPTSTARPGSPPADPAASSTASPSSHEADRRRIN